MATRTPGSQDIPSNVPGARRHEFVEVPQLPLEGASQYIHACMHMCVYKYIYVRSKQIHICTCMSIRATSQTSDVSVDVAGI